MQSLLSTVIPLHVLNAILLKGFYGLHRLLLLGRWEASQPVKNIAVGKSQFSPQLAEVEIWFG